MTGADMRLTARAVGTHRTGTMRALCAHGLEGSILQAIDQQRLKRPIGLVVGSNGVEAQSNGSTALAQGWVITGLDGQQTFVALCRRDQFC